MQKIALNYLKEKDWSIIPVREDKKPLTEWQKYQNEKATEETVLQWFTNPEAQIAIVTGKISNLIVVDIDKEKTINSFRPEALKIFDQYKDKTLAAESGSGGHHLYFNYPSFTQIKNATNINDWYVDVRGEGGYVLAPPSKNSQGQYKWLNANPIIDFPRELFDLLYPKDDRFNNRLSNDVFSGVVEGGRNNSAAQVCGKLLHHFPEGDWNVAWELTRGWNKNNVPPMSEEELNQVFTSIARREKENHPQKKLETPITFVSWTELQKKDLPPISWLVENLIPNGGITAISGDPGAGKTWLALEIANSVANGTKLLETFETKKANVLIIDEESGETGLKTRMEQLNISPTNNIQILSRYGVNLLDKWFMSELVSMIKANQINVVIFDSFVRIHNAKENDATDVAKVMNEMKKIADEGITVIFLHHNRKSQMGGGLPSMRGSSDILAAVDSNLSLSPNDNSFIVSQQKSRWSQNYNPFTVKLADQDGKVNLYYLGEAKTNRQVKAEEIQKRIIVSLQENPDGLTKSEIYEQLSKLGNPKGIRPFLEELIKKDFIKVENRNGNKQLCFINNGFDQIVNEALF